MTLRAKRLRSFQSARSLRHPVSTVAVLRRVKESHGNLPTSAAGRRCWEPVMASRSTMEVARTPSVRGTVMLSCAILEIGSGRRCALSFSFQPPSCDPNFRSGWDPRWSGLRMNLMRASRNFDDHLARPFDSSGTPPKENPGRWQSSAHRSVRLRRGVTPTGRYQASNVSEWKSMTAKRSPRRPMTSSVSAKGPATAR